MDWMDWILLRKLVLLEHLAMLKMKSIIYPSLVGYMCNCVLSCPPLETVSVTVVLNAPGREDQRKWKLLDYRGVAFSWWQFWWAKPQRGPCHSWKELTIGLTEKKKVEAGVWLTNTKQRCRGRAAEIAILTGWRRSERTFGDSPIGSTWGGRVQV